jgi:hypothetical protein
MKFNFITRGIMWREENFAYLSFFIENPTKTKEKTSARILERNFFPKMFLYRDRKIE